MSLSSVDSSASFLPEGFLLRTSGIVRKSITFGTTDKGVLLANASNALVDNNVTASAGFGGIQIGFRATNPVRGTRIFENVVTGTAGDGILLTKGTAVTVPGK